MTQTNEQLLHKSDQDLIAVVRDALFAGIMLMYVNSAFTGRIDPTAAIIFLIGIAVLVAAWMYKPFTITLGAI